MTSIDFIALVLHLFFTNLPGAALPFSTLRRILQHDRAVRESRWKQTIGSSLSGKVLGVLGFGKLGSQVARVGQAFGMKVSSWSQNLTAHRAREVGVIRVGKNE